MGIDMTLQKCDECMIDERIYRSKEVWRKS